MIGAKSNNIRTVQITSNIPAQWDKIINFAKEFDEYYYIFHDKDKDENGETKKKHIHCVVYDRAGTTLLRWCARWQDIVPANMVDVVLFKQPTLRYLTHETAQAIADGKYRYPRTNVITNVQEKYLRIFQDNIATIPERFSDFQLVKSGKMSAQEFVEKYRTEISDLNFYHQLAVYREVSKYGL